MSTRKKSLRIAIAMGGMSAEREVSLVSGEACARAVEALGHQAICLDVKEDIGVKLFDAKADILLNALHGRFGEDGTIQGLCELMGLPYTHSGVLASALAMDKEKSKMAYRSVGLPVAQSIIVSLPEVRNGVNRPMPYVVKPYNDGSSVGVVIVNDKEDLQNLPNDLPEFVMVEDYLEGRELTASVMGDKAIGVTEIVTEGWYDFRAKYNVGGSQHICPANLPKEIYALCEDYALKAHQILGCKGVSRTDFRWNEELGKEGLFLLETNTQPGLTPTSLTPEHAELQGMSFVDLIEWMIEDASCSR